MLFLLDRYKSSLGPALKYHGGNVLAFEQAFDYFTGLRCTRQCNPFGK